jgi:L,D-peptidoglycan transpeptidase YkuD (ErfK/YbiS/YcfS/YnhG family)
MNGERAQPSRFSLLDSCHPLLRARFSQSLPLALLIACLLVLCPRIAIAAAIHPSLRLAAAIPEIISCKQLVTVTTKSWGDVSAIVRLYERSASGESDWRRLGHPFPAAIGQRGLAWGIGLHGTGRTGEPAKREGDRKAPAGVFRFGAVFGTAAPKQVRFLRLPYRQVTSTTEAIDDPRSKYYNQIVERSKIAYPDWVSSESMLQVGGRYRLGVVIEHNIQAVPGFGSCIFLHVWDPRYSGTSGCIATDFRHLVQVLRWLDPEKRPLIVQLPVAEYERLRQRWGLPRLALREPPSRRGSKKDELDELLSDLARLLE